MMLQDLTLQTLPLTVRWMGMIRLGHVGLI